MADTEHSLAVFIDFENLALGFEGRRGPRFEIQKVLERLVEKGKIIVKRSYADWGRFREYRASLHEAAIELIEIPRRSMTGKNSADIRLVVDAMDLSYSKEHVDTFVIISGDSDFSPLVSKLKENGKRVIGLGMKNSTSDLLIDNCDEFIFYEDLDRPATQAQTYELTSVPAERRKLASLVMDAVVALRRENKEVIWSSMVKDTIKRKKPQFNESYYGYRTFSNVLEDLERFGLISLTTDPRSGTYVIAESGHRGPVTIPSNLPGNGGPGRNEPRSAENGGRDDRDRYGRRRRGGRGRWEDRRDYERRDDAWTAGAPGSDSGYSGGHAAEEAGEPADPSAGTRYEPLAEGPPAAEPGYTPAGDDRDDYGFPSYSPPATAEPAAPAELEPVAAVAVVEPEAGEPPAADDDRTPEEREMDARAARMAHSRVTTDSPLKAAKPAATGRRPAGPRTGRAPRAAAAEGGAPSRPRSRATGSAPAAPRGRRAGGVRSGRSRKGS